MGHQIIKQPDGHLAVFSTVTGTWILVDASRTDLIEYYAERAAKDARERTAQVIDQVEVNPREAYFQFALTFEDADSESHDCDGPYWDWGGEGWLNFTEARRQANGG